MNLVSRFFAQAKRFGDKPFVGYKTAHGWETLSWNQFANQVACLAQALTQQGIQSGDRVLLIAENRPEWTMADLAIMATGAIVVPAYTTHTVSDLRHVLELTEPKVAIISNASLAERVVKANVEHECLTHLMLMDEHNDMNLGAIQSLAWPLSNTQCVWPDVEDISPDDICALIFTSGTGGKPKAAMLTHANVLQNVEAAKKVVSTIPLNENDRFMSFLPLAHAYEHMAGLHLPISLGSEIYYCESLDKLAQYLGEVSPTVSTAVPRLYDTLYSKIRAGVDKSSRLKQTLFAKTLNIGRRRFLGQSLSLIDRLIDPLLSVLVRKKLKARFGGRIKYFVSGGAALNPEVGLFFSSLNIGILQGYGQTEAAPLISVNLPGKIKIASVGPAIDGVEVKLSETGELLVRGNNVMQGYWRDEKATAMTIKNGWLYTGDLAEIDRDGYITISGRAKDLIVTSGGDNISPVKIESLLTLQDAIAQAVIVGDGRSWLSAVIVPEEGFVKSLSQDKDLHTELAKLIKQVNESLSTVERVRKFVVRDEMFSIENGYLTPTQKVKRAKVIENYAAQIDALYTRG
jgi:long-chain acyl-CoA synthetase